MDYDYRFCWSNYSLVNFPEIICPHYLLFFLKKSFGVNSNDLYGIIYIY